MIVVRFLAKGDFYDDWPNGRGQFHNHDGTVMVWVGEEDHIRCMSLEKGSDISSCYNKATRVSICLCVCVCVCVHYLC